MKIVENKTKEHINFLNTNWEVRMQNKKSVEMLQFVYQAILKAKLMCTFDQV